MGSRSMWGNISRALAMGGLAGPTACGPPADADTLIMGGTIYDGRGGEHTGNRPGRFVRGPGWSGWKK